MGLGTTAGYFAIRALLAVGTGGASEAAFIAGDIMGAAFAAAEVVDAAANFASSGQDLSDAIHQSVQDGKITPEEGRDLLARAKDHAINTAELKDTADHLRKELRGTVSGDQVLRTARQVRCSVCGATGVNKATHVRSSKNAHKHNW